MNEQSTLDKVWQAVLGEMELLVGKANFSTWFKNTGLLSLEESEAVIQVPNAFVKEWLAGKYKKEILSSLKKFCSQVKSVRYSIGIQKRKTNSSANFCYNGQKTNKKSLSRKTALNLNSNFKKNQYSIREITGLNPRYTFDSYIVGSNNALAEAASKAVGDEPGKKYNPLFIYGGVGLGKTHLIQAIGNEILSQNSNSRIKYINSEAFATELVGSIRKRTVAEFKEKYRQIDVLLIDDIQFMGGKEKTQEEFFHLFNHLYQAGKQIVICSDRPPREIATLQDRLCSRFEGGMMADISQPDLETRIAILDTKAREQNLDLDTEILGFIASRIQNNIRELEGALNKFIASCQLSNQEFSLRNAKNILADMLNSSSRKKAVTPKHIVKKTAKFFNLKMEDLLSSSRRSEIVKPRQIAIFLMRKEGNLSYPAIGDFFKKDHSTIMHSYNKIKDSVRRDESLMREINAVRDFIYRES